jgi:hypothetical protein
MKYALIVSTYFHWIESTQFLRHVNQVVEEEKKERKKERIRITLVLTMKNWHSCRCCEFKKTKNNHWSDITIRINDKTMTHAHKHILPVFRIIDVINVVVSVCFFFFFFFQSNSLSWTLKHLSFYDTRASANVMILHWWII